LYLLEEGHNHPIVRFEYLCHMIGEELIFFPFFHIKLLELGVKVALNHRSAVTHHKVNLLKNPPRSSSLERTDDAEKRHACKMAAPSDNGFAANVNDPTAAGGMAATDVTQASGQAKTREF